MKSTATLHRYPLQAAASELGIHPVTLRKALKARGIEPSGSGGFTLAELVRSQVPAGNVKEQSLKAHAELQQYQAALAGLKLAQENGELIEREGALQFMSGLMRAIYDCLHHVQWPADIGAVEEEIKLEGIEFFARNGWSLQP